MELEIPSLTASSLDGVELVVVGEFVTAEPLRLSYFHCFPEKREKSTTIIEEKLKMRLHVRVICASL